MSIDPLTTSQTRVQIALGHSLYVVFVSHILVASKSRINSIMESNSKVLVRFRIQISSNPDQGYVIRYLTLSALCTYCRALGGQAFDLS